MIASVGPLDVPWAVEVGEHVSGALLQGAAELGDLLEAVGHPGADRCDQAGHQVAARGRVGVAVGLDHAVVDPPGDLDRDMVVACEQGPQPGGLLVGEEVGAGVQRPTGLVERVVLVTPAPVDDLLDPPAAFVQRVVGQADDVEGVHHRDRVRQFFGSGGLEAGEPVHRDHFDLVTPGLGTGREPGLEDLFGAALDHVQQLERTQSIRKRNLAARFQ